MQQKGIVKDTAVLRTLINYEAQNFATKRLLKDKDLIDRETTPTVGVTAQPLEHDLFIWHANIRGPEGTPYEGGIFHVELQIPQTYPHDPPQIQLFTDLPHPNVFGRTLCLDMLDPNKKGMKNVGWSSAYTIQSVLLQLQAFLFEEFLGQGQSQKEKKELIKKAVKEANEFKCSTKNCKHGGKLTLWPKFNEYEQEKKAFINIKSSAELIENDFVCFHTKLPYRQITNNTIEADTNLKKESCLGILLQVTKVPRTGAIKAAVPSLDYISIKAFLNEGIKHDSMKYKYQFWLPLYFGNKDNKERVLHLLKRSVSMIMTNHTRRFKPEFIIELFPRITQSIGFNMMDQKTHPSIRRIRLLTQIHALWLLCMEEWPQLYDYSDNILKKFIENEQERDKNHTPNLGILFNLLYVSKKYTFDDLIHPYVSEQLDRQVFWILKEIPELGDESKENKISAAKRAEISYKHQQTPYQMGCFQYLYLSVCKNPFKTSKELLQRFEENFCLLSTGLENAIQARIFEIYKKILNYDSFYDFINQPRKSEEELELLLKQAIKNSKAKNYHGTVEEMNQVPDSDVQVKEYFSKFTKLEDLFEVNTEAKGKQYNYHIKQKQQLEQKDWKELLIQRWTWVADELYWNPETTATEIAKLANDRIMYGSGEKPTDRLYTKISKSRSQYEGYENIPAAQLPFPEQTWEQVFMKLDFEEQLLFMDSNPDFKAYYAKLAIIKDKLTDLTFPLIAVNHITSAYHYITGALEKLTALQRLAFTRPTWINVANFPKKAAKAIYKGLNNLGKQKNNLTQLIYHRIQFAGSQIEQTDCLFSPLQNFLDQIKLLQIENNDLLSLTNTPKAIGGLITNFRQLQYLILKNCLKNVNQAKEITDGLMRAKQILYVDVSNNLSITEQGLASMAYNLSFSPKLQYLNMSKCGQIGSNLLQESLFKLLRITGSLEVLDCSYCTNLMKNLSKDFYAALGENRTLKALNLNFCGDFNNSDYFGKAIAFNAKKGGNLQILNVRQVIKNYKGLENVVQGMMISNYDLEMWYGDQNRASKMLNKDRQTEFYCNLQILDIQSGSFASNFNLINYKKSIYTVYTEKLLSKNPKLLSCNFYQNQLNSKDMDLLQLSLNQNSNLIILNLGKNKLEKEGAKILASLIKTNKTIQFLDVSDNSFGVAGGQALAEALRTNSTLKQLNIFDNMIGFDGAKEFGVTLAQNTTLEILDIGNNRIRNKGLFELTEGLAKNNKSGLKCFGLRFNFLTEEGVLNLLKKSKLNSIFLKNNSISDYGLFQLKKFYDENKFTVKMDIFNKLVYVEENQLERTIWVQPSFALTDLVAYFAKQDVGVILNARNRKGVKYPNRKVAPNEFNFIEFANPKSVNRALALASTSQAIINGKAFRIYKAGTGTFVYQKKSAKQKKAETSLTNVINKPNRRARFAPARGRGRGRGRGTVRGRGRG